MKVQKCQRARILFVAILIFLDFFPRKNLSCACFLISIYAY